MYRQAQYLARGVANSSAYIDTIFGVEPDQRREIIGRVRQRARRGATTAALEPPQSTGIRAWEVFNGITAAARDEVRYHRRTALERLAGDVMHAFYRSPRIDTPIRSHSAVHRIDAAPA